MPFITIPSRTIVIKSDLPQQGQYLSELSFLPTMAPADGSLYENSSPESACGSAFSSPQSSPELDSAPKFFSGTRHSTPELVPSSTFFAALQKINEVSIPKIARSPSFVSTVVTVAEIEEFEESEVPDNNDDDDDDEGALYVLPPPSAPKPSIRAHPLERMIPATLVWSTMAARASPRRNFASLDLTQMGQKIHKTLSQRTKASLDLQAVYMAFEPEYETQTDSDDEDHEFIAAILRAPRPDKGRFTDFYLS